MNRVEWYEGEPAAVYSEFGRMIVSQCDRECQAIGRKVLEERRKKAMEAAANHVATLG